MPVKGRSTAPPEGTDRRRVRYFARVTYFLGGLAIGLVLLVVLIMVGVKNMKGRD